MKVVNIFEEESKFVVRPKKNKVVWDREFIIYQWFENQVGSCEAKYKLIVDILNLTIKFVKVEKDRLTLTSSNKQVTYLDINEFDFKDFVGVPFVMKRRSIKSSDAHLDFFIYSNNSCEYMLELEREDVYPLIKEEIILLNNVSTDPNYRNINMTILFELKHYEELQFILKVLK